MLTVRERWMNVSVIIFFEVKTFDDCICLPACTMVEKVISRSLLLPIATTYMTLVMNVDRECARKNIMWPSGGTNDYQYPTSL